jgi:peptidoglycan/LPS O-acetylase OafA/YrhL
MSPGMRFRGTRRKTGATAVVAGPVEPGRDSSHVTYMPGLDGVRAIAVLAVMAYHGGIPWLQGGFFGVDAFFVLSGFLITLILVTERIGKGRVSLGAFWARRARRLLPALLVVIVAVALYARFFAAPGTYPDLRWDALSAMFYVANWHFILSGQNYFLAAGPMSPLLHTWSLSIEEQFYLVWPLVVVVTLRRAGRSEKGTGRTLWALVAVSVAGAAGSAIDMAVLYRSGADVNRLYFGSDTHAQCLLVGTALAAAVAIWRRRGSEFVTSMRARVPLAVIALIGVGVCAWAWSHLSLDQVGQSFVFEGGFAMVSVCVAAVLLCAVLDPRGIVSRILSLAPLRFLGRISYGVYLWHWPLDIALTESRVGVRGYELFGVRSGAAIAIATVSYYAIEQPIRRGSVLTRARAIVVTPVAVAGTVVAVVAATAAPAVAAVPAHAKPAAQAPASGFGARLNAADEKELDKYSKDPVRVLVVGDSVALTFAQGLYEAEKRYDIQIYDEGIIGCGVAIGKYYLYHGTVNQSGAPCSPDPQRRSCYLFGRAVTMPCQSWQSAWEQWIKAIHPNLVVLLAGRWEVVNRTSPSGKWTNILDPSYASYVEQQLELAVQVATSQGSKMVIETAPCYSSGEQPDGDPWPEDSSARLDVYNDLVREVAAKHPSDVTVQDLDAVVCPGGVFSSTLHGVPIREPDGVHFENPLTSGLKDIGGEYLAPSFLPLWESIGHLQEAASGGATVVRGPPFPELFLAVQ